MTITFAVLAGVILVSGVAAMTLRNLIHCALALAASLAGLAAVYLHLGAQFIGLAQILVYIGAVAILVLFAILLTRGAEPEPHSRFSATWVHGAFTAGAVFFVFSAVLLTSKSLPNEPTSAPAVTVAQIGDQLMTTYVLPLQVIGLLLTAALIGAVILAMRESSGDAKPPGHREHAGGPQ